jgi:hypothetical protein
MAKRLLTKFLRRQALEMKIILVAILIAGNLFITHALKCYECTDVTVEANNKELEKNLKEALPGDLGCNSAVSSTCLGDKCSTSKVSYTMEDRGFMVSFNGWTNFCHSFEFTDGEVCDEIKSTILAESLGRTIRNLKCQTGTCSTDGCNLSYRVRIPESKNSAAIGLSISIFLQSFIAFALLNFE